MLLFSLAALLSLALGANGATVNHKRAFNFAAPHYSLYLNDAISYDNWPSPDKIKPYNRVLMAFWQTNGAQATPSSWAKFSDQQRQTIINNYHDAGIALMVSAFGDDDHVISNKADPVQTAQSLASWVKQYSLDGVDIDMEDFTPLQNDKDYALDWLTKFHAELSTQLPSGSYAISSTPTAWMYGSAFGSADSVYCKLNSAAGSSISWYNMQLYNGHPNTWDTCENTFWQSSDPAFLSIKQISDQCSIPLNKITAGKLWSTADLATADVADEVPAPAAFGACINQAKAQIGYPGTGIMIWAAHMDNWDGAINYLSDTIAAMNSAPAASSASNGTTTTSSSSSASSASTDPSATVSASQTPGAVAGAGAGAGTSASNSNTGSQDVTGHGDGTESSGSSHADASAKAMGASSSSSGASSSSSASFVAAVPAAMMCAAAALLLA